MAYSNTGTENTQEIGQKLRDARHRLGLSQAQLAVILGVSDAALSRWEHGNRNPRAEHSQQILRWLQQVASINIKTIGGKEMPEASMVFGKGSRLGPTETKIYEFFKNNPTIVLSPSDYDEAASATGVKGTVSCLACMANKGS